MLNILKHFTLGVRAIDLDVVQAKLDELSIRPTRKDYQEIEYNGMTITKVYLYCLENEDQIEKLSVYLKEDFKGIASITY